MKISRRFLVAVVIITLLLVINVATALSAPNTVRVWVEYKNGHKAQVEQALKNANAQFHYDFKQLNSYVVTLPSQALTGVQNNPNVASVEGDPVRELYADPVDFSGILADTVDPNGQIVPFGVDAVQARDVWDADRDGSVDAGAPTGAGRTVCIIDTGYYQDHEDLPNAIGGYSQVDNDWARDGYGHGTHVAGTIAAENNNLGVVGVTPGAVDFYIVKFFNDAGNATFASDLVDAVGRCESAGANVISMSLGGSRSSGKENRAFQQSYDRGVLHIAAAGNDGNTAYSYPASYDSVVSVAAIDENNAIANFSQQNNQVEIAAPGVSVLSTVPYISTDELVVDGVTYAGGPMEGSPTGSASGPLVDGGLCETSGSWSGAVVLCERGNITFAEKVQNVVAGGGAVAVVYNNIPGGFAGTLDTYSSPILALTLSQEDGQFLVANKLGLNGSATVDYTWPASGYEKYNGTSMATPHVSAVAALVWSANPSWTNVDIRDALNASALDLGAAGRDNAYGYGLVQAADALALLGGGTVDNPPTVSITSPSNGASYTSGASISFSGSAIDAEDGDLTANLIWTSNLDGQIGTGGSFSTTLSDGTHTITASVTDSGGKTGTDTITVTVGSSSGGGALVVDVTTDKSSYVNKETVFITVTVTDGSAPVEGASVDVQVATPKFIYSGTATTDTNGQVVFTFGINSKKDGTGTYQVTANASKAGYTPGTGSTSFVVN